jgi:hypothetical protein
MGAYWSLLGLLGKCFFVDGVGYGMFATWVPLVQIETASIGDNSGGSQLKNDPWGDCYMFWTNRARIRWGPIDQASRCDVGRHRQSNKSKLEARKQDMHVAALFKSYSGYELTPFLLHA